MHGGDDANKCDSTQLLTDNLQEPSEELSGTSPKKSAERIPADRAKNITKKPGFVYLLVTIDYVKGPRFGLGIKHHKDKVVVSKSEKGSLCGDLLKRLDRIIDVNGTEVADRDVCREMLIKSLKRTNKVTLVIERPVKKEAIEAMEDYLADACRQSLPSSPTPNVNNIKVQNVLSSIIQSKANNSHRNDSIGKGKSLASKKLNSNEKNDSPEKGRSLSLRKKQSDSIHKGKNAGFRKLRSGDKLIDNLREVYKSMRREPSDKTMREHESPVLVKSKKGNSRLKIKRKSEIHG